VDHADRLADLTLWLCAIPSVTGNEADCARFVAGTLESAGLTVERIGASILVRTVERPRVVLFGHTDTVPPKPSDGPPRREGSRIIGLGASDMKGGLAVMLALAVDRAPGGFVFYDREEGPWAESGLGEVLERAAWLREAELAFCLEPSDNVVQVGCMGSLHARVTFRGRAAHSARPWQGDNAIHRAAPLLARLAEQPPLDVVVDGHLFREVLSATMAEGGSARNVIPDRFSLNLNYRFSPARSLAQAEDEVRALAGGADVEIVERAPSGRVVTDNVLLRRFLALNGNEVRAKQAWTDVARLTAAGLDAVNLGPGLAAQAHQAGEYADAALLATGYRQFASFLGSL
jgi:succinyl-diaminopimelate desuccinylase